MSRLRSIAAVTFVLLHLIESAQGAPIVLAELGGVELLSIPQPSPGLGFVATLVQIRTVDRAHKIVTLENIRISNTHQVWTGGGNQAPQGNADGPPIAGPLYADEWIPFDSHLTITSDMVGGCTPQGYHGLFDTNDDSTDISALTVIDHESGPPMSGFGVISLADETATICLIRELQQNTLDLAYVVTTDNGLPIELTAGIYGEGTILPGYEGGAAFGYHGSPTVHVIVPEPRVASLAFLSIVWSLYLRDLRQRTM